MTYDLSFVHLGITIEDLPNHFTIFGFRIAFYGIIIGIGMLAGIIVAMQDAKRRGQNPEMYLDFAIYGIIFAIIGARLYYVIFSWQAYKDDLLSILNLRAGGLAIYGGVIAGLITLFIYSKLRKQSFFSMADTSVLGLLTGQIIGRWGNFFNCEAFGGYTDSLFAMRIKKSLVNPIMLNGDLLKHSMNINGTDYIQVHPTFLYESVWNLCLLIFLLIFRKKKKFNGEILLMYLGGYGFGRMLIESLRTDQLHLWGTPFAVSQLLGGACFVVSTAIIIIKRHQLKDRGTVDETRAVPEIEIDLVEPETKTDADSDSETKTSNINKTKKGAENESGESTKNSADKNNLKETDSSKK